MRNILVTLSVLFSFTFSPLVMAQDETTDFAGESIKDISTIVALGAGGAILGLSTLSFVEEPGDHLKNIVVGGAIGIIIGVGVVAWTQANKSKDLYNSGAVKNKSFDTYDRMNWHMAKRVEQPLDSINTMKMNYSFSF